MSGDAVVLRSACPPLVERGFGSQVPDTAPGGGISTKSERPVHVSWASRTPPRPRATNWPLTPLTMLLVRRRSLFRPARDDNLLLVHEPGIGALDRPGGRISTDP